MALRFFRRVRIAPGVTLNLSKRGGSLSFGTRGARLTVGRRGIRRTIGLPGTGLFYTKHTGYGRSTRRKSPGAGSPRAGSVPAGSPGRGQGRSASSATPSPSPTVRPEDRLTLGFFRRLVTSRGERGFVDGMRAYVTGDESRALAELRGAVDIPDAAFMVGILAIRRDELDTAERYLQHARRGDAKLGRHFAKYGVEAAVTLPITERIAAQVGPNRRGLLLAMAEVHQAQGRWREAVEDLVSLHRLDRRDIVVLLSLAELLVEEVGDAKACRQVVRLTKTVENESEIHTAVLLWKGKALRLLGLNTAARDTFTAALRRSRERSDELLRAIRYERALVYEALGQAKRARGELEKLYAEAPDFEDVAERLGLSALDRPASRRSARA